MWHSTRLNNFKVTNTRSGDRHSHPEDRLIFIQVVWFCDAAKKMSLYAWKSSYDYHVLYSDSNHLHDSPMNKIAWQHLYFSFWDAFSFPRISEQSPRWCFVSQQQYLPFFSLSIRSAISLPWSLEVQINLFLAHADLREAMRHWIFSIYL